MKIRQGFVSNSSSSSFLIIAPKDEYDKIISKLTPYQKAIFKELFDSDEFLGQPIKILCQEIGTEVPETLTSYLGIDPALELGIDPLKLFESRYAAFRKGIQYFRGQPGVIFKETY